MIKICFLTHNIRQDNGAGVFSHRLIEGLQESLGAEVVALTTEGGEMVPYERSVLNLKERGLLSVIREVRKIVRRYDIVHALDGFPYGVIAAIASLGLRKKLIITTIGSGSIIPLYSMMRSRMLTWSYKRADIVTAISNFTKQEIQRKIPKLTIRVINPGVDYKFFKNVTGSHIDTTGYTPYILSVGALRWRKGYKFSIPAFKKVSKEFSNLTYVIVGKQPSYKYFLQMKSLIDTLGLKDKVIFLDTIDDTKDLVRLYRGAELFCLMSQNLQHDVEGFGLVFLEAAASGLPVVGTKPSGIEDAMEEGKNGFLVGPKDIDGFADAISRILKDKELKKSMQERSLELARVSSWEARIAEYLALYKRVI